MNATVPPPPQHDSFLLRFFRVSLVLKGLDGVLELIGGLLFLLVKPSTIDRTIAFLTRHEIAEDPHDFLATFLIQTAHQLSVRAKLLASIYLLSHGAIKVILVIGLLLERKGYYPPALVFLGIFVLIEAGRLVESFSIGIFILMLFDLFVITLVWLEFRRIS